MSNIIKCSVCGQEYLPSEIFMPKSFFGNPGEIIKNTSGQIEFFTGTDMNLEEEYICDNCNTPLKIKANIDFEVESGAPIEITEEYVSTFNKPDKMILSEEELF